MKSITLLALLVVAAALCLVEGRAAEAEKKQLAIPKAPLAVDFDKLEHVEGLTKERLEQFRQAIEAFKAKIDATRMNTPHREAIKNEAMARLAERIAKLHNRAPKVEA